jgi:hypothetical protein
VAVSDLELVALWISLKTPTIEDGGNFGVLIQQEIKK